jgi:hypothetical protein
MKMLTLAVLTISLVACQKENTSLPVRAQENNLLSKTSKDTVVLDQIPDGKITDDHSGKTVCFFDALKTVHDTFYAKRLIFCITKSNGTTLTQAILYIDGYRFKTVTPIIGDSLKFTFLTQRAVLPENENLVGKHTIAVRIVGDGAKGQWYRIKLVSVVFLSKTGSQMVTVNQPQSGEKMIYL